MELQQAKNSLNKKRFYKKKVVHKKVGRYDNEVGTYFRKKRQIGPTVSNILSFGRTDRQTDIVLLCNKIFISTDP